VITTAPVHLLHSIMKPLLNSSLLLRNSLGVAGLAISLLAAGCCCTKRQEPPTQGYTKSTPAKPLRIPARCTPEWMKLVDQRLQISDSSGHGPDIGSIEWMNAVGRKSGVTDAAGHGPDPGGDEWCRAVDYKVFGRR
jgi:hypothetical protein